jgi:hypothetical protein
MPPVYFSSGGQRTQNRGYYGLLREFVNGDIRAALAPLTRAGYDMAQKRFFFGVTCHFIRRGITKTASKNPIIY